jgi:hypothetical protein
VISDHGMVVAGAVEASVPLFMFLMQLRKHMELSMNHFIGNILQVSYLYFSKGEGISIRSTTSTTRINRGYFNRS